MPNNNETAPELALFPYQRQGVNWLKIPNFRCKLLADEMGLGKTAQVITAIEEAKFSSAVIVCPSIARYTWANEFKKWGSKLRVRVIEKRSETPSANDQVIICSFDYATNQFKKLSSLKRDVLVVDESHFLKSLDAKRTAAVLGNGGVIHSTRNTWFLTGTPMPNHPGELWPMLYTFAATRLPYERFIQEFCYTYLFNGRRVVSGANPHKLPKLRQMLNLVMLRRKKADVLTQLPPVIIGELFIEASLKSLPRELAPQYEAVVQNLERIKEMTPLEQIKALELMAESVSTLRRFCALQKIESLAQVLEEELTSKAYAKIIIFCIHREVSDKLAEALYDFNPAVVHGGISAALRQRGIDRFQGDPACRVFIGNIQAAGTNITLTAADQVIFVEESWVPGDNAQAIARAARIGQTRTVNVRRALIRDSIDETVSNILFRKSADIAELLAK